MVVPTGQDLTGLDTVQKYNKETALCKPHPEKLFYTVHYCYPGLSSAL